MAKAWTLYPISVTTWFVVVGFTAVCCRYRLTYTAFCGTGVRVQNPRVGDLFRSAYLLSESLHRGVGHMKNERGKKKEIESIQTYIHFLISEPSHPYPCAIKIRVRHHFPPAHVCDDSHYYGGNCCCVGPVHLDQLTYISRESHKSAQPNSFVLHMTVNVRRPSSFSYLTFVLASSVLLQPQPSLLITGFQLVCLLTAADRVYGSCGSCCCYTYCCCCQCCCGHRCHIPTMADVAARRNDTRPRKKCQTTLICRGLCDVISFGL